MRSGRTADAALILLLCLAFGAGFFVFATIARCP